MKKRSLIHQLCFNIHTHLLKSLIQQKRDIDGTAKDLTESVSPAEFEVAKIINLNKKDMQGVVPLCLLIMNMTPIERKMPAKKDDCKKSGVVTPRNNTTIFDIDQNFAKSAANFFSQDFN